MDRITDVDAKLVITSDGGYYRGGPSTLKPAVDEAIADCPSVKNVLVVEQTGRDIPWGQKDVWWSDVVDRQSEVHQAENFPSEQALFLLYTSPPAGKPKRILYTTGGFLTQAAFWDVAVLDLKASTDVYWCTADVGWDTGYAYAVYAPLANACTSILYGGTPETDGRDRWWQIVEQYKVSILYMAPNAIRRSMEWGDGLPCGRDLSSIRVRGSVGEPINPEAWLWFRDVIGGGRCPIVDTWWQSEMGAMVITPLPGVTSCNHGPTTGPLPGISIDNADKKAGSAWEVGGTAPWTSRGPR